MELFAGTVPANNTLFARISIFTILQEVCYSTMYILIQPLLVALGYLIKSCPVWCDDTICNTNANITLGFYFIYLLKSLQI